MWFKNLILFKFTEPFAIDPQDLEERLASKAARPCGKMEPFCYGWVPPMGRIGKTLTHVTNGNIMICARKEEKVLPAAVIRESVEERAAQIAEMENRNVSRFERQGIRDEVIQDLLPRAFVRGTLTYAYIVPSEGWLIINATSARKAEELTSLLRDSLGRLTIEPPAFSKRPAAVLTGWLSGELPADFEIEDECELRDPQEEGGVVRCRRQDLGSEEIRAHLNAGKQVVRLAVGWDQRLSFVLDEDLSLKRLKFSDIVQDEASDMQIDSAADRFDADFAIMTLEFARLLNRLFKVFEEKGLRRGKR